MSSKKEEKAVQNPISGDDLSGIVRKYEIEGGQSVWTKATEYIRGIIERRIHRAPVIKTAR